MKKMNKSNFNNFVTFIILFIAAGTKVKQKQNLSSRHTASSQHPSTPVLHTEERRSSGRGSLQGHEVEMVQQTSQLLPGSGDAFSKTPLKQKDLMPGVAGDDDDIHRDYNHNIRWRC